MIKFIDTKLKRAATQITQLSQEISDWNSTRPISCRSELKENRMGFQLIVNDFDEFNSIDQWQVNFGECIHNMRSLLDNLCFALARIKEDPPRHPRRIKFPIYQREQDFVNQSRSTLQQLPDDVADLIEKIQPFQRNNDDVEGQPEDDPLVLLNWLSNQDKHTIPLTIDISPENIANSTTLEYYSDEDASKDVPPDISVWADNITPNKILLEHRAKSPLKRVYGKYDYNALITVSVKEQKVPVLKLLSHLLTYTNLVVNQFRPFFN